MSTLYEIIVGFVIGEKWKFHEVPEHNAVTFLFDGENGPWRTFVRAFEDDKQVAVYGILPFEIHEEKRAAASELITRANYGLIIGNFEMDFNDGEVRFKTSVDVEGSSLEGNMLAQLIHANLSLMDYYIPAFVAVAARDISASDALALVE